MILFIQQANVNDYQNTLSETDNAQNAGIRVFSIGINGNIDSNYLRVFSMAPEQQNREWYRYNSPSDADNSLGNFLNVVCFYQGQTPTTSSPAGKLNKHFIPFL